MPGRASFVCLPAEPKRLEYTLAILVEAGVAPRRLRGLTRKGKRETSTLIRDGHARPDPFDSVLEDLRDFGRAFPDDPSFVWRELSAPGVRGRERHHQL